MLLTDATAAYPGGNTRLLWIVFASHFTFGMILNVVGVTIPVLIGQYRLSLFAFALYIPFGVCSIPAGLVADRLGPKPAVLFGVFLMAVGCGVIPLAKSFLPILISPFIVGAIVPPLVGLSADHFGIRSATMIPLLCFFYVLAISLRGRAKHERQAI